MLGDRGTLKIISNLWSNRSIKKMSFTELSSCKLLRIFRNNEIFLDVNSVL